MIVIRNTDITNIETPGANATAPIATPSRGAQEVSIIRQRQQPGGGNPAHRHDREEVMLITRGTISVTVSDGTITLHAGDTLIVPAQTTHQLSNPGPTEAEWLLIAPAGIAFFHANGDLATPTWAN